MKIAIISPGLTTVFSPIREALEEHVYQLSTAIAKLGHMVFLFDGSGAVGEKIHRNIRRIEIPNMTFLSKTRNRGAMNLRCANFAVRAWVVMKQKGIRPDIIHTHIPPHGIFFSKVFHPTVFTSHSPWWEIKPRPMDISAIRSADACIALSTYMKGRMEFYKAKKAFFVPNGVDVNEYHPPKQKTSSKRLLFVGRVCPQKGLEYLMRAMVIVQKEDAEVSLTIVGPTSAGFHFEDYSYYNMLKELISKHGLKNITFTGMVSKEKKLWYYRNSDMFVLPSVGEGMSFVMLEALASGLPIVSTDVSGAVDVITHGINGYIVEKRNPSKLAEAILNTIGNKTKLSKMSSAAREKSEGFGWDSVATKMVDAYGRIA